MQNLGQGAARRQRWWGRGWVQALAMATLVAGLGLVLAAEYILHHAEPLLRQRIVETLSARFDAPVQLDHVEISLLKGIEVNGYGLRIDFPPGTPLNPPDSTSVPPMVAVTHFAFRTSFRSLLHQPTRVAAVRVDGMEIHIPPSGARASELDGDKGTGSADHKDSRLKPKVDLIVSELRCRDVKLVIEPGRPGKLPLEFDISALDMQDVGKGQAMRYDAMLTNPKPIGLIHAVGHFGPWSDGQPGGAAGQTPLDGTYNFDHADLKTIKGIGGMLSSRGRFAGTLDRIVVDGQTDVPDFSLDISNRPVPLHTNFHAIVDGTSGDTFLQPVQARLASSAFTTSGKIIKVKGQGHDIALTVDIPHGRMEDFLRLATRTSPPLLSGLLTLKATLHIPPDDVRVPQKLAMAGAFELTGVRFNHPKMQDRVDALSARAQGNLRNVSEAKQDRETEVHSTLSAHFTMGHGVMELADVHYAIPGALVLLNGVYSMDGKLFEFKGRVRTDATASQMVAGWKGMLLKPLDQLLQKNGAGVELPLEISGTQGDVHMGFFSQGTNDTPQQMLTDVRQKNHLKREISTAQKEAAQASADDAAAARATSLEAAEAAHNRAVQHRAEAQRRLTSARKDANAAPQH